MINFDQIKHIDIFQFIMYIVNFINRKHVKSCADGTAFNMFTINKIKYALHDL